MTKEVPAFVCSHIFERVSPVLLVSREDADWQLLCGGAHGPDERPRVVGLNHLFEADPSLLELENLPPNWEAARTAVGSPWMKRKLPVVPK